MDLIYKNVFQSSKANPSFARERENKVFHMVYLVSKSFVDNNLKFTDELKSFLQVLEPLAIEHYPKDVLSNEFRYLIQGLFFSKEYYEAGIGWQGAKLFDKIVDSIRNDYMKLLEGEHRSYNINKICRVLSSMDG